MDIVLVDPATGDDGEAIKRCDVITIKRLALFTKSNQTRFESWAAKDTRQDLRCENAGQQVTDNTTNTVDSEDIQSLINTHHKLELSGKVATDATNDTEDDGSPGGDVTSGGRDGHETRNSAGAETNHGPLLLQTVVEQDPGDAADGSSEVRDDASHDGAHVGGERRAAVEAEPADPQEDGAEDDVGDVVRAVRQAGGLGVAGSLADHDGEGERGGTGRDVHRSATGEVEASHLERPAVGVPGPVRDRVVHYGGPDEHKDDAR